jgi:hypothetical protein
MRAFARASLLVAVVHATALTSPAAAWAQGPAPVPYPSPPDPVPYGPAAPLPPPARGSAGATEDTIFMKNGGILRGTIIDVVPGAQARMQLATGEIATVPWSAIGRIEHGAVAAQTPPPVGAVPEARRGALVVVQLEGADGAELQRRDGNDDDDWVTVCSGPCNVRVPVGPEYRIAGGGIRPSRPFQLAGAPGDRVTIDVTAGSTGWFVLGIVIIPIGGVVMLTGLVIGLIGSAVAQGATGADHDTATAWASGGWVTFALGTAAMVGGVLLVINNGHSSVTQNVGRVPAALLLQGDAWKRAPAWKEATPVERALPPVVGFPVWTGRF